MAWHQSHAVRAPLANVMGLVQLIQQGCSSEEEFKSCLTMLELSAKKLHQAVNSYTERQ